MIVVKSFPYRGVAEEWANVYHLSVGAPGSPADWRTMADGLINAESAVLDTTTTVERVLCYEDTNNPAVYTYELADFAGVVTGTYSPGSTGYLAPGDSAAWIRWDTGRLSSKGKKVYLRKYFHPAIISNAGEPDGIIAGWRTLADAFGGECLAGMTGGFQIGDPAGALPTGAVGVSTYATTRTLKRRGRRPTH
jgi:hypothetical protein